MCACGGEGSCFGRVAGFSRRQRSVTGLYNHSHLRDIPAQWREYQFHVRFRTRGEPGSFGREKERDMSMLERLSDARGTLEGKIVAVILAVLLVLPVASVTAFAGGHDHESDATGNTEEVQTVSEELPDTGSVALDETPAPEEEVPGSDVPEPEVPGDPTEPEAPGVPAAPEPEDPPAATPTEEPTETEEPEATTVEVQLKIDEGATLKLEDDTFYTEDDTKMELTSDQEKEFTIEVNEGYELAVEKPVVFKDVEDAEEELEAVDGKYTFPTNVMDGGKLFITANVALAGAPEEDAIAPVAEEDDGWVAPASPQRITADYYCTSRQLGTNAFVAEDATGLGSSQGMDPIKLAPESTKQGDLDFYFHHAQIVDLNGKEISGDKLGTSINGCYNVDNTITSIRFNQSANNGAGAWECKTKANPSWTAFALGGRIKLIFFYNQQVNLDDNVTVNTRDWPWSESEWKAGKYASYNATDGTNGEEPIGNYPKYNKTDQKYYWAACVVYQLYDSAGKMLGDQIRTYYYSPTADKAGVSLSIAEYWNIDEICVSALEKDKRFAVKAPYKGVTSPSTYDELVRNKKLGYTTADTDNFTIPFASLGNKQYNVWIVGAKIRALPSEASLAVEYLDAGITDQDVRIHDPESVPANKPNGTPDPTWNDYVSFDGDKLVGDPDSVEIVTNISNSTKKEVPFKIDVEGYASKPVRAVLDGLTLKLYYNPVYTVGYSWSGDAPNDAVLASGNPPITVPTGTTGKGVASGTTFDVDKVYQKGTLAYTMNNDGKVINVYQFSGWNHGDKAMQPEEKVTVEKANILFTGTWSKLTYSATIEARGKTYDGDPIAATHVTKVEKPTGYGDPTYQYRVPGTDNWTDEPPIDAGTYEVKAVWPATDKLPALESQPVEFTINKLAVTLQSASATKTFDGSDLTAHKMVRGTDEFETEELIGADWGFAKDQGVKITYTGICTQINSSVKNTYTYESLNGANLEKNYQITPSYGALLIQPRNANSLYKIDLTAASSRLNTYKGEAYTVSGLAMLDVVDPTTGTLINGDPDNSSFQLGGNTYTVSGYTAEVSAEVPAVNVGLYPVTITGTFVVKNQRGEVVTDQFAFNKFDGTLEITQRSVALASESATKVYDGYALTAPIKGDVDEVLAAEANVETTGSVTNVKKEATVNTITVTKKENRDEGINEYNENNYVFTKDEGTLTITPQSITKDPQNPDAYKGVEVGGLADEQYNGTAWAPKKVPTVKDAQKNMLKVNDDYTVAFEQDTTNVGTKTVTITGKGNYMGTVTRTFDVTPAPVVIMVDSYSKVYGQDDPTFTGTAGVPRKGDDGNWKRTEEGAYEVDSLFKNDRNNNKEDSAGNFTYVRSNADVQNVGTYKNVLTTSFDAANADAVKTAINANYSLVEVIPGNFSITQATATLNATGVTTTYDANEYAISVAPMGEEGWTVEYATTPNGPWGENPVYTEAGQYPVYVKATNPNYVDVYGTATVTINPAPVTIRVNDATKVAGSENPEFTGAIEGEVAGHELTGVSYYRKSDAEGIGTYENDLTASFDDNPNYTITVEDGDFTITAMPVPAEPVTPPTTPAPGPLDGIVTTVTDFLATPIIGAPAVADTTAIDDAENPLAQIEDDGTPMSAFDAPICWIHYYILLGIIITAIYGGGVIARRLGYSHKVKSYEDDVTGKEKKRDKVKDPAPNPAQPTI